MFNVIELALTMDLAAHRESRGLSQGAAARELGLRSKSYISGIESGSLKAPLELALQIQKWSGGEVRAADLRPDLADLIAVAAEPSPLGVGA